jgi:hypothetical protein
MILTIENYDLKEKITHSDTIYSMSEHYIELLDIGGYDCTCSIILHQGELVEGLYGFCDWDVTDKLAEVHIAMGSPAWGITLAHEMVHVKQNLQYGITAEGPAYDLEYELYSSWKDVYEPTR